MAVEHLHVVGLDHHRSPLELRERMAVPPGDLDICLADLCEETGVEGAVVLSTCNRSEFYLSGKVDHQRVIELLAERQGVVTQELRDCCYHSNGPDAVRHLFRVVASLESMVVGEYQIMHQVRHAFEQAKSHRTLSPIIDRIFQRALAAGKAVRNETGIGAHKLSMASIAVDLAQHIHGNLDKKSLLVIGAGEMAELAVVHFLERGMKSVTVINRHRERALELSRQHGDHIQTRPWSDLQSALGEHDVVLASTAAAHAIITPSMVEASLGKGWRRRRVMFIDLAIPRDVDPGVNDIEEAYVYNVDDLEQVVHANRELRDEEVVEATQLIDDHIAQTLSAVDDDLTSLRREVATWFEDVVQSESKRLVKKLALEDGQSGEAEYALKRVAGKLQHRIQACLSEANDDAQMRELIRRLLG